MHFCVIFICLSVVAADVIVHTDTGTVAGYSLNITGQNVVGSDVTSVEMFLGVPYAEPPVGDLRFARPVAKRQWHGVFAAKTLPYSCPQRSWFLQTYTFLIFSLIIVAMSTDDNIFQLDYSKDVGSYSFAPSYHNISEDCLYLNIYAPKSQSSPAKLYPVMVWIHGGSYTYGAGGEYDGRILAQENVVVVTVNYRLGVIGFLSTDDAVAPGNYGLLDQLLALEWLQRNIDKFRGDPNRVTIFGQSAGGGSVSLHMFSNLAKGLFSGVIPQSGCALSPWAIYRPPHQLRNQTISLATSFGCVTSSSIEMVACLRKKSVEELVNARVHAPPMIAPFAPRVDNYYITDLPENLLSHGEYLRDVRMMSGFVPQEVAEDLEGEPGIDNGLSRQHIEQLFYSKSRRYLSNAEHMNDALKCAYPPSDTDVLINRQHAINMNSDYGYVAPHIRLAQQLGSRGTNVWLYNFTYRSTGSLKKDWIGVPHAEELYYLFGAPFMLSAPCPGQLNVVCPVTWGSYQPWAATDRLVSRLTMQLWTEFAYLRSDDTYIPVPMSDRQPIQWPQYITSHNLLNITSHPDVEAVHMTKGIEFWTSYNYLNITEAVPDVCHGTHIVG